MFSTFVRNSFLDFIVLQSWYVYFLLAFGNIVDGVCDSTHTKRAKEFGGDNFINNLRVS